MTRKVHWLIWGGLFVITISILVLYAREKLVGVPLPVYSSLPDFTLTNQEGQAVSLASLRGRIWVVDTFFSRCPGQCLRMSKNLSELQAQLDPGWNVQLVSITTDPGFDSPRVLKQYAGRFRAGKNWCFLCGEKRAIDRLAVGALKLCIVEKERDEQENPDDLFIHSAKFVLIDRKGRVRGYYDGEAVESRPMIVQGIKSLLRE